MIPLPWAKIAGYAIGALAIVGVCLGLYLKGRSDGEAAIKAEDATAVASAQKKADDLANELVIAQAQAMATNGKTVTVYRTKVASDPSANDVSPAVRDALRGVKQLSEQK